jgi:hypothetical protein
MAAFRIILVNPFTKGIVFIHIYNIYNIYSIYIFYVSLVLLHIPNHKKNTFYKTKTRAVSPAIYIIYIKYIKI